jgi:hypothetical protein
VKGRIFTEYKQEHPFLKVNTDLKKLIAEDKKTIE